MCGYVTFKYPIFVDIIVREEFMRKRFLVIGLILLFICMSITQSSAFDNVKKSTIPIFNGNTLYVGGNGPDNYTRIQDAIDNASDGDTVFVFDDSSPYHENIVINKSIFLIGEDKNNVVLDGDLKDNVITITDDDVFVSGFTMIHPCYPSDIWDSTLVDIVSSENVTIKDNFIRQYEWEFPTNNACVVLRNSSYCFIQNNTIISDETSRAFGVVLLPDSKFNNISGNEISLFISGVEIQWCSENVIYMNYLHHNLDGVDIWYGNNNTIINNIINFNSGEGISFEDSSNNQIIGNTITDNGEGEWIDNGIYIGLGSNNYISYNHISRNNPNGILILSIKNYITYNDFSNNPVGVYCEGYHNHITKNNFMNNKRNAYLKVGLLDLRNFWDENYWNRPRFFPYPVFGLMIGIFNEFLWVNFDWHPAQEPYDI